MLTEYRGLSKIATVFHVVIYLLLQNIQLQFKTHQFAAVCSVPRTAGQQLSGSEVALLILFKGSFHSLVD